VNESHEHVQSDASDASRNGRDEPRSDIQVHEELSDEWEEAETVDAGADNGIEDLGGECDDANSSSHEGLHVDGHAYESDDLGWDMDELLGLGMNGEHESSLVQSVRAGRAVAEARQVSGEVPLPCVSPCSLGVGLELPIKV
jgi:hypothetical protein